MAPAVGYARTLASTNISAADIVTDWALLESQAALGTNINLIVKGTIDGQRRGLLFQPGLNLYKPDTTNLPSMTHSQLAAKVLAGDTLTFMGVPPGSGQRMAIDRDLNGVLDADEPPPSLQANRSGTNITLSWPYIAAFALETAPDVNGPWTPVPQPLQFINNSNQVVLGLGPDHQLFRLRTH
jgi:hypothetical protein